MKAGSPAYWTDEERPPGDGPARVRVRSGQVVGERGGVFALWVPGEGPQPCGRVEFVQGHELFPDPALADDHAHGRACRLLRMFSFSAVLVTDHTGREHTIDRHLVPGAK